MILIMNMTACAIQELFAYLLIIVNLLVIDYL